MGIGSKYVFDAGAWACLLLVTTACGGSKDVTASETENASDSDTDASATTDTSGGAGPDTLPDTGHDESGDGAATTGDASSDTTGDDGQGGDRSAGCGMPWDAPDVVVEEPRGSPRVQTVRRTIDVAGVEREYLVVVPEHYDADHAYTLIFGFHGGAGSREQLRRYMNLEPVVNGQAIFIYPSGLVLPGRESTGWVLEPDSDDLAFVDALLEKYTGELCIDESRIFATGHSYGGCMSNTVGCYRGDVFRAIAPVAGCGPFSQAACVGQIASLQIHSPKDTSTTYRGAVRACTRYLRANGCDEMPECGCHWVDELESPADECIQEAQEPYPTEVDIPTTDRDERDPILRQYLACDPGYPVIFADHWWRERNDGDLERERWHNPPPWVPALVWEFFSNLPRVE